MSKDASLRINGLQRIDYLELEEVLPSGTITELEQPEAVSGQFGEPVLLTAILLTVGIRELSRWLAARRAEDPKKPWFKLTTHGDGTVTVELTAEGGESSGSSTAEGIATDIEDAVLKAAGIGK
jgi:hypothetical protein